MWHPSENILRETTLKWYSSMSSSVAKASKSLRSHATSLVIRSLIVKQTSKLGPLRHTTSNSRCFQRLKSKAWTHTQCTTSFARTVHCTTLKTKKPTTYLGISPNSSSTKMVKLSDTVNHLKILSLSNQKLRRCFEQGNHKSKALAHAKTNH